MARACPARAAHGRCRDGRRGFATSDGTEIVRFYPVSLRLVREGNIPGFPHPWQHKRVTKPGVAPGPVPSTASRTLGTAGAPADRRSLAAIARDALPGLGATTRLRPCPVDGTSR